MMDFASSAARMVSNQALTAPVPFVLQMPGMDLFDHWSHHVRQWHCQSSASSCRTGPVNKVSPGCERVAELHHLLRER